MKDVLIYGAAALFLYLDGICVGKLLTEQARLPRKKKLRKGQKRVPEGLGFDPYNPINCRSEARREAPETQWYEVKPYGEI